jgi:hypothetical protein
MLTVAPTLPVTVPSTFSPTRFKLSSDTGKSNSSWSNGAPRFGLVENHA